MIINKIKHNKSKIIFFIISCAVIFPTIYLVGNSFMSKQELIKYYGSVFDYGGEFAVFNLLPDAFSLEGYYQALLRRPEYLLKFWNSLFLCTSICIGQIIVSLLGAYAFSKFEFKFKKILFGILFVVMLMPIQVTIVPNYLVIEKIGLLNTFAALIVPNIFSPFGTVFLTLSFNNVPNEILQAAQIDGAEEKGLLFNILVPMCKNSIISVLVVTFVDNWNMVEQPVAYLSEVAKYPLSVFLSTINYENFSVSFSCGVLSIVPVILIFAFFNKELVEGIEFLGMQ
ncbi:MAG: carbohydrate ABC transporter permease [Oscillospiraceae bacterium]